MTRHPVPVLASGKQLDRLEQGMRRPDLILMLVGVFQTCGLMNGVSLELLRLRLKIQLNNVEDMHSLREQIRRHRFTTDTYGHPLWVLFPQNLPENLSDHDHFLQGSVILTDFAWNLLKAKGFEWMRHWMDVKHYRGLLQLQKDVSAYNHILSPTYCPTSTVELCTRMITYFFRPLRFRPALFHLMETAEAATHRELWRIVLEEEKHQDIPGRLEYLETRAGTRDHLSTSIHYVTSAVGNNMDRSFILNVGSFGLADRPSLPEEYDDAIDVYIATQDDRQAVKAQIDLQHGNMNHPKKRQYLRCPIISLSELTDLLHDQCGFDEILFQGRTFSSGFREAVAHTLNHAITTASSIFVGNANRSPTISRRRRELADAGPLDLNAAFERGLTINVVQQPCTSTIEQILSGNIQGQPAGRFLVLLLIRVGGQDKWILWAPFISPANYIGGVLFPVKRPGRHQPTAQVCALHVRNLQNQPAEAQELLASCLSTRENINFVQAFFLQSNLPANPVPALMGPLTVFESATEIFGALHNHCSHLQITPPSEETTTEILRLSKCNNASSIVVLGYQVLRQATTLDNLPIHKRTMSAEEALDKLKALQANPIVARKIKELGIQPIICGLYRDNWVRPRNQAQAPHSLLFLLAMSFIVNPTTYPITQARYTQWFLWAPKTEAGGGGILFPDKNGNAILIENPPSPPSQLKLLLARHLYPLPTANPVADLEASRPKLVRAFSLGRAANAEGN